MKIYSLEHSALYLKYNSYPAKYYAKRLESKVTGIPFDMHLPHNDWRDDVLEVSSTAEKGLIKVGDTL